MEVAKRFATAVRPDSLPFAGKTLLLAVSLFLFLILNTVGAGAQTITPLPLGSSVAGRIDPGDEVDIYELDLSSRSGITDVWIYTTGDFDTWGELYDSSGTLIIYNDDALINPNLTNFHLRRNLAPGVYYVGVYSADDVSTGDYILHAAAIMDPGSTTATATRLNLDTPTPGSIDAATDDDYFRIDFDTSTNLILYARGLILRDGAGLLPLAPIDGEVLDATNNRVTVNITSGYFSFVIRDDFGPGTYYIRVTTPSGVDSHPVPYTIHAQEDTGYTEFIENCENAARPSQIDDPLYPCQWHLNNVLGEDINVEPVWSEGLKGEGINIAVVDDGMDWNHEDLVDNVNQSLNHDYTDSNDVHHPFEHHGTNVAGIIAARDNGIGVRGVAPRATIYGYNFLVDPTVLNVSDAMIRNAVVTAVSNNSIGLKGGPGLSRVSSFWEMAVESGIRTGYDGKGVFYTFAGGNYHLEGDNSNLSEVANFYAVTAVCAVNDGDTRSAYSEMGANLWTCAPSNDDGYERRGIVTTENSDRYLDDFGGTSAATPIVSGVAALMRQANPNLTWRDLKLILAASARKNDPTNIGWEDGARRYGSASGADRYHFNHEYGFGVVDAKAAVDMAKGWSGSLPPLQSSTTESRSLNVLIPDAPESGVPATITRSLTLSTDVDFTEFIEVNVTFDHPSFRDLDIDLVSPSGAVSHLTVQFNTYTPDDPTDDDYIPLQGTFRLGSARHLGEDPNGEWQLMITDHLSVASGTLQSWSITTYGHRSTPVGTSECATLGAVSDAMQNPGLVSDCETLLEARDTLVGTGTSLNWSASLPMTSWDGATVEGTPARVTVLSLRNRGLAGTIPAQLGNLTALRGLSLSTTAEVCQGNVCRDTEEHERNRLTGPIPSDLGRLSKLEWLSLSRNELTGPIPADLSNLTSLSLLALGGNQLTGPVPTWLGGLTNLEGLYLWGNKLSGPTPTELGNLANLKWLELGSNQLSGTVPADIGNIANLERLTLHQNQLSGQIPTQLGSLSNLQVLSLWDNQLTGPIPTQLGSLPYLERLHLSQNQLSGTVPTQLGDLSNLKVLSLWSNQLTGTIPTSLIKLANLEELYLSQNQFTGCVPAALQDVPDNDLADLGLPFCVSPSVTLSTSSTGIPVRINSPIPVTATFSGPVSGFTASDITVANGLASNFAGGDGDSVFTFDVLPNAIGVVTVDIPENVAVDAEGNGNTAAVRLPLGMPYDDNNDGTINSIEVLKAVADYFRGLLTAQQILAVVGLYFASSG